MYYCLVEVRCSQRSLSELEIQQLSETVKLHLDPSDQFAAICRRMVLSTSLETYMEVKEKLSWIQESFEKEHGPFFKLICGFAEVKDGDMLGAIGMAKQMLARATDANPLSGMYYYRFCI